MAEFEISATIEVDGPFFDEDAEVVMRGPEGPSAYELAVEEGFEGTLEEWLDSLGGSLAPNSLGILDPDEVAATITFWGDLLGASNEGIENTKAFLAQLIADQPDSPQVALQNASSILALLAAQDIKAASDVGDLSAALGGHVAAEDPHEDRAWAEDQLALKLDANQKGAANGVAELDEAGIVLARHLPGYLEDLVEIADEAALAGVLAVSGRIYIALAENTQWRWSGSTWVNMSSGVVIGTTSSTAHRGDHGAAAYTHSQITNGNPHGTTAADVGADPSGAAAAVLAAAITKAIMDAKGDIVVGSAPDTAVRVSVGADGTTLVADANSTAGVIWATPNRTHNFASGQYTAAAITLSTAAATNNRVIYQAINVYRRMAFDRIAINHVSGVSSAGSICRLGIFLSTGEGLPGAQLLEAGTPVNLSTAAGFKFATITATLNPGQYLLAAVAQFTGTTPVFAAANPFIVTPSSDNVVGCKFESGVTGALPSIATPFHGSTGGANLWLRAV